MIAHLADSWTPRTIAREPEPEVDAEISLPKLMAHIVDALAPFAEARKAVTEALARFRRLPESSP
jgi:hypothetical protein